VKKLIYKKKAGEAFGLEEIILCRSLRIVRARVGVKAA
jgi:hypothetical protein